MCERKLRCSSCLCTAWLRALQMFYLAVVRCSYMFTVYAYPRRVVLWKVFLYAHRVWISSARRLVARQRVYHRLVYALDEYGKLLSMASYAYASV